jgi:hypothetical protein
VVGLVNNRPECFGCVVGLVNNRQIVKLASPITNQNCAHKVI